MSGEAAADLLVIRIGCRPAGVSDRCREHARRLPEDSLGSPKTAQRKDSLLKVSGKRAFERISIYEMGFRYWHWLVSARHCFVWIR